MTETTDRPGRKEAAVKLSWLLRGSRWRWLHVHRCLECGRKFADTGDSGCWTFTTGARDHEFPELCGAGCKQYKDGRKEHNPGCRAVGPYCSACAARVAAEQLRNREGWH